MEKAGDPLVEAALAGNSDAISRILERLGGELLPFASALTGASAEADALVGDTLSRAYERLGQLQQPEALSAWARRILLRLYLDHRRWQRRRGEVSLESVALTGAPAPADLGR